MAIYKENLNNTLEDDLNGRNANWGDYETHKAENTSHYYEEENEEISLNFRNKFFYIDENNDVFFRPDGDGNAGSSLGEQGYINLWKVV